MVEYINTPYYCLSNIVANLLPPKNKRWYCFKATDYDEYYKWQNQQRADIRAGMMIPIKYEGDENSPFAYTGTGWSMDTSKQWASQKLPATKVRSETMDWTFQD